jgi:DNA-binding CsgD family transcriptional regulator
MPASRIHYSRTMEREAVKRIKLRVQERLSNGETIESFKSLLNGTEFNVLQLYILAKPPRPTVKEVAGILGLSYHTISAAKSKLDKKLQGKGSIEEDGADGQSEDKFREMSKRNEQQARKNSPDPFADNQDRPEGFVARRARGLDKMLANAYESAIQAQGAKVFESLSDLECILIGNIAISGLNKNDVAAAYGTDILVLESCERKLIRKLSDGIPKQPMLGKLKGMVEKFGPDNLPEFNFSDREKVVLERRVLAEKPESLRTIGKRLGISYEMVRQIEIAVYEQFVRRDQ